MGRKRPSSKVSGGETKYIYAIHLLMNEFQIKKKTEGIPHKLQRQQHDELQKFYDDFFFTSIFSLSFAYNFIVAHLIAALQCLFQFI